MSLKAKMEAVIYASEEPVTLAQLVGVLGQEAQLEMDRDAAVQQELLREQEQESAQQEPGLGPDFDALGGDPESEVAPPQASGEAPSDAPAAPAPEAGEGAAARAEKVRASRLKAYFRARLDELVVEYAAADRGIEIREVAGGFRFATKPEYHDAVRGFVKSLRPPLKLTLPALETLAVVAYKQPVTAPEISEIRGVDSSGVLGSLLSRKLITTAGRKQVIGRPILYKTTKEFLVKFGLKDVAELPSIEEFEKMAGQLTEQEEIPIPMNSDEELRPHAAETEAELGAETEAYAPKPEQQVPTSDVTAEDRASIDGRLSSLPPDYAQDEADDPSAEEARIQQGESS